MKTSVCWIIFAIVVIMYYVVSAQTIIHKCDHSKKLPNIAKQTLVELESKELEEIKSPDENTSIVVLDHDGSHVHLDTHAKIISKEGNIDRHDSMQLFKKMKNESNIVTDYVIDDKLNVISAAKNMNDKYCVIAYSLM